jgi:hypothetical protein
VIVVLAVVPPLATLLTPDLIAALIAGLLSAGLWQFVSGLMRRKPELEKLDAETESLRLATADRLIIQLDQNVDRGQVRERALEEEISRRGARITELEGLLRACSDTTASIRAQVLGLEAQLSRVAGELAAMRAETAA